MRPPQNHQPRLAAVLASLLLTAVACNTKSAPTPQNFTAALNSHFLDHPDCLFPEAPRFPYETSDPAITAQMNTLVTNQLLTAEVERNLHVSRYTPTPAGIRATSRFCYGHRIVSAIDSFTPPIQANGFPETQTVYTYAMQEVPVWARSADILTAFPNMAHNVSGTATAQATLAATMAGWQVPD